MLSLMRWLAGRSLGTLHIWGALVGWLAYLGSPTYRRRLRAHATLAGVSARERRASVAEAGRMVAELPWLWLRPQQRALGERVQWRGEQFIEQALDAGRGLLLLTPHLGSFEVTAQAFAERWGARVKLTVMYRPARQVWLSELQETARRRPGLEAVPATLTGVRQMIRALRRGESVGLLPDQVPPEGMGVWAPFFGREAYTMTLAARLVQQTGAELRLVWTERLPRSAGWRIHVSELPRPLPKAAALADVAGGTVGDADVQRACARTVNEAMESLIRQAPQQYLWAYNRYKPPRPAAAAPERAAARSTP